MANDVLESGEILKNDAENTQLREDLDNLAKSIDVKENSLDKVNALFKKLEEVDPDAKNRALQYALDKAKITVGNKEITVSEIAKSFDNAVEQDNWTWKIKLKDGAEENDKTIVEWFLNEKKSSLARLIQLASKHASLQAKKWYGRDGGDTLVDVGVDNVFWNQTLRALSWLQEWIEGDYTKEVDVSTLDTPEKVLGLKFIPRSLKEKIEAEWNENVKNMWKDENYEFVKEYTNNFALKPKGTSVVAHNDVPDVPDAPDFMGTIETDLKEDILNSLKQDASELLGTQYLPILTWEEITIKKSWTNIEEKISVKKCLKQDKNINHEFIKSAVANAIDKIKTKEKAIKWADLIKTKRYELTDIFSSDLSEFDNDVDKSRVRNFFWVKGNNTRWGIQGTLKWISFNQTVAEGENIWLVVSQNASRGNYMKSELLSYKNNVALKLNAKDIVDDDYLLKEDALKGKLKTAIIWIIKDPTYAATLT